MSEHGACLVFSSSFKRSTGLYRVIWGKFGGLFFFFLKEKINQQYICVNTSCPVWLWIMVITMTDPRDHVCLGLWKLGQFLKILLYTQLNL